MKEFKKYFLRKYDREFGIFLKHGSKYVSAKFFLAGVSFIAIPIYTRLLTPSDYGILAVFNSAVGIFAIIYDLQMYGSVGRYYLERTDDFPDFLGTNLLTLAAIIIIEGAIFWIFKAPIMKFFAVPLSLFPLLFMISILSIGYSLYGNLLVAKRESGEYTIISALRAIFLFALSVGLMYHLRADRYLGRIYAQILVTFIICGYSLYKLLPGRDAILKLDISNTPSITIFPRFQGHYQDLYSHFLTASLLISLPPLQKQVCIA